MALFSPSTFTMPSFWHSKSKQGHQWLHLAVGNPTVKLATSLAVYHFNVGSQTLLTILGALGIYLSFHGEKACKKLDMTKFTNLQKSERKAQPTQKPQRLGMSSYWQFQFCVTSEGAGTKVCHAGCMQVYPYCHLGHAPVYCHYC